MAKKKGKKPPNLEPSDTRVQGDRQPPEGHRGPDHGCPQRSTDAMALVHVTLHGSGGRAGVIANLWVE